MRCLLFVGGRLFLCCCGFVVVVCCLLFVGWNSVFLSLVCRLPFVGCDVRCLLLFVVRFVCFVGCLCVELCADCGVLLLITVCVFSCSLLLVMCYWYVWLLLFVCLLALCIVYVFVV